MAILQQTMTLPSSPSSSTAMSLIHCARGKCTPSLLPSETDINVDSAFLASVSNLVDFGVRGGECLLRWFQVRILRAFLWNGRCFSTMELQVSYFISLLTN